MADETGAGAGFKAFLGKLVAGFDYVAFIREDAEKAWAGPNRIYLPRLPLPSGGWGNIEDWVNYIEAIEDVGWVMDFWAVSSSNTGDDADAHRPVALPLFRKPQEI